MVRLFLAGLLVLLFGCSGDEERMKMRRDIANLQEQIYKLEQTDQSMQQRLDATIRQTNERLEDRLSEANQAEQIRSIRDTLLQLEARLTDLETKLAQKNKAVTLVTPSTDETSPSSEPDSSVLGSDVEIQFNTSYGDFSRAKYDLAAYGFEELLNNFPDSPYAEQCHYYLGRSYYELKRWQDANTQFGTIIQKYPKGSFYRQSLLYQGKSYYYLNMHARAVSRLQELIKNHPGTQEADLARSFLKRAGYER